MPKPSGPVFWNRTAASPFLPSQTPVDLIHLQLLTADQFPLPGLCTLQAKLCWIQSPGAASWRVYAQLLLHWSASPFSLNQRHFGPAEITHHEKISLHSLKKKRSLGLQFNYCLRKHLYWLSSFSPQKQRNKQTNHNESGKVNLYLVNCDDIICNDSKESYICWPADKESRKHTVTEHQSHTDGRLSIWFKKNQLTSTWLFDCRAVEHPLYAPAVAWYKPSDHE